MTTGNPLFDVLDAADGRRDGEFLRAIADRVDAGAIYFEPSVEYGVPDGVGGFVVNINWGFAVPEEWLATWAASGSR